MKKLKVKVFFVTFGILSLVLFGLFLGMYINTYSRSFKEIEMILKQNIVEKEFIERREDNAFEDNNPRKVFMEYNVYTVILDDDGNYLTFINHSYENDSNDIEGIATEIINNHKENYYIGNLLFNKYSYSFNMDNTLVIVDNTNTNISLITNVLVYLGLFILLELVLYVVSNMLTKWIIDPVNESFERQKRFVADASHELKTPLTVIMTSTEAYQKDKDEKWIKNIKNESERMTGLVKGLLDLSLIENENNNNFKEEDLSKIIESTILTDECLFFESKIKLDYKIEDNIKFDCDKNQIKQLLTILMDNALRHSEKKGNVVINLYKDNKNIILEVKNKGLPINPGDEEKIFERFYKADKSRNRDSNNYGLGLAIAKTIVNNHGGDIVAFSKEGYTTFKIKWNQ